MLVLIVDTSSAAVTAGVASFETAGFTVLAERVTVNGRGHAELLTPAIVQCLAQLKVKSTAIGAVIAGLGPGPFTGLRVGLMTAAAFADALSVPSYGVCSLDAVAAGLTVDGRLLVAGDARRREVYWACYRDGVRENDPGVGKAAEIETGAVAAAVGAGVRLYPEAFGVTLLNRDYPTIAGLASCAASRVSTAAPSETLTPLYLRRPDAVVPGTAKKASQV